MIVLWVAFRSIKETHSNGEEKLKKFPHSAVQTIGIKNQYLIIFCSRNIVGKINIWNTTETQHIGSDITICLSGFSYSFKLLMMKANKIKILFFAEKCLSYFFKNKIIPESP